MNNTNKQLPSTLPSTLLLPSTLPINIDFDEASRKWRDNKIKISNSLFAYKCRYIDKNSNECCKYKVMMYTKKHKQYKFETHSKFCVKHYHNRKNMKQ